MDKMYKWVTQRENQNDHKHKKTRSLTENRLVLVMIIISCILAYQKKKKSEYTEDAGTSEVWNVNWQTHLKINVAESAPAHI